jgi:hypothetical protein
VAKMSKEKFGVEQSDEWWFERLFRAFHETKRRRDGVLRTRVGWYDLLWNWYLGIPELPQHSQSWQSQVTIDVLNMGRANFAKLAVDSKLNRIKLESFRPVEAEAADADANPDGETPAQKQARRMMARYSAVFDEALLYASVMGCGYLWAGPPDRDGLPTFTAEDPRECITINDPVDRDRVIAALKMYRDEVTGYDYAIVAIGEPYTPTAEEAGVDDPQPVGERIRVARRPASGTGMTSKWLPSMWEWDDDKSKELPIQGRGPLVHRVLAPQGLGDFEPHLDLLARINNMIVDRLWISKFQVFRQRVLMDEGAEGEDDYVDPNRDVDEDEEDTGDGAKASAQAAADALADELQADPGAVWRLPKGYKIWESTPTDMTPALSAVKDDIKEFAASTFTPLYVFTPDAVQGSAEGASLAREGQVYKAEAWWSIAARPFLDAIGDLMAIVGLEVEDVELKWMPAERYSLLQKAQAAQYAQAAGVPWEGRMQDYMQLSPDTIRRYKQQRRADLLFAASSPAAAAALGTAKTPAASTSEAPPALPPVPAGDQPAALPVSGVV